MHIGNLLQVWDGEEIVIRHDRPTGAWIVIAIHSTRLGPAAGGTRMRPYPSLEAAVQDAMNLARGMTLKYAVADFPRGGGKAVIAVPPDLSLAARHDLLLRYGALIRHLGGLYRTGPDVGTGPADMDVIAETGAPWVHCRTPERGGAGDSAPATALGVLAGIEVTCAHLFRSGIQGKRVLVQGAGSVGMRLMACLRERNADLLCSDVLPAAVLRAERETGARPVASEEVYDTPCDLFVPCALGGILNERTIPRLRCRAVVGAANNQLADPADAERLAARGILYAPDFVVNIGGAVAISGIEALGWTPQEADRHVEGIVRSALGSIYDLSRREKITTVEAAERVANERLQL